MAVTKCCWMSRSHFPSQFLGLTLFSAQVAVGVLSIEWSSIAAGKAPSAPSCGTQPTPSLTTPAPMRKVVVQNVGTKAFQLPNGIKVDLGADLQSILTTALVASRGFLPVDPTTADPCDSRVELRSAVTSFQLNIAGAGITFGYSPSGSLGSVTSITGTANVEIGEVAMDFSVWSCEGNQCSALAASTSNQLTAGLKGTVEVDFSTAKTAATFLFNSPLGEALRQIMLAGIDAMPATKGYSSIPWRTTVRDYIPSTGLVIFDGGDQIGIGTNQAFEIYAPTENGPRGVCNVFQVVAQIHTTAVDTVSSTAVVDRVLDSSRGVLPGDIVMIRTVVSK